MYCVAPLRTKVCEPSGVPRSPFTSLVNHEMTTVTGPVPSVVTSIEAVPLVGPTCRRLVTDTDFTATGGVLEVEGLGSVVGVETDGEGAEVVGRVTPGVGVAGVVLALAEGESETEALALGDGLAEAEGQTGGAPLAPGCALVVATA